VHQVRRAGSIVSFRGVLCYVPFYPQDYIQNIQVRTADLYEADILASLDQYVPDDAVIFDIGSNIGNQALYWALIRKARRVYAFEPVGRTFAILQKNIELNRLENLIIAQNVAVSDIQENLTMRRYLLWNIGRTRLLKGGTGAIPAITLDSFRFADEKCDFVKIDVEGFEVNVLKGGLSFLQRYQPKYIFVEIFARTNQHWFQVTLGENGYQCLRIYRSSNFLYEYTLSNRTRV
jgi:FkbM family methyltransferase